MAISGYILDERASSSIERRGLDAVVVSLNFDIRYKSQQECDTMV